jgi:flavin reductase (DIM6/NTAB) family NADH-FMN oxidoreductase RutF
MQLEVSKMGVVAAYRMLTGLIVPRPIAWVTTISATGVVNLAPFSFFNLFGANPPIVVFSPTLTRAAAKKDTLNNIEANGEFVIHASTESHAEQINQSSASLPPEESELTGLNLATVPSVLIRPPRLRDVPFALECKLHQVIPIGQGAIGTNLIIGEVLMIHVDEAVLDAEGQPDPRKIRSIARLGGEYWCKTQDLFTMVRPS